MLLWREKIPGEWLPKVLANLDSILIDHCHLERKAAASALSLMKYRELHGRVRRLNAIAIEELEHFNLMLDLLERRGILLGAPSVSPWIRGLMKEIRKGRREQVIDHLICCSLIEGRSCEKFQVLAEELKPVDAELARLYGSLVESEANHYVDYWLMARDIDNGESHRRLDFFLGKDAALIRQPHGLPLLH
jgi:tRNA-(ms[2]io[6]A)-hydroxylase